MNMRYQVKCTDAKGVTHYGIYIPRDGFNMNEYKDVPKGTALASDAILPVLWSAPESTIVDVPLDFDNEYDKHVEAEYWKAQDVSDKLRGFAKGKLFSVGVADGSATYIITKVNKNTCDVEWRGYGNGDRYTDHYFGWGRKGVAKADVARYVGMADFWKSLKAKAKA